MYETLDILACAQEVDKVLYLCQTLWRQLFDLLDQDLFASIHRSCSCRLDLMAASLGEHTVTRRCPNS